MDSVIKIKKTGNKIQFDSPYHSIEFDSRFGENNYPFTCFFNKVKLSESLIKTLESSKIIKVDSSLSFYDEHEEKTSLHLVPRFGYTTERITRVLFSLIASLAYERE